MRRKSSDIELTLLRRRRAKRSEPVLLACFSLELYILVSFFFQHQKHHIFSRSPHVNEKFGPKTGSRTHFCIKFLIHMRRTRKKHHFLTKPSGDPNRKSPLETPTNRPRKPKARPGSSSKDHQKNIKKHQKLIAQSKTGTFFFPIKKHNHPRSCFGNKKLHEKYTISPLEVRIA